jgi:hypothetical protein
MTVRALVLSCVILSNAKDLLLSPVSKSRSFGLPPQDDK